VMIVFYQHSIRAEAKELFIDRLKSSALQIELPVFTNYTRID